MKNVRLLNESTNKIWDQIRAKYNKPLVWDRFLFLLEERVEDDTPITLIRLEVRRQLEAR